MCLASVIKFCSHRCISFRFVFGFVSHFFLFLNVFNFLFPDLIMLCSCLLFNIFMCLAHIFLFYICILDHFFVSESFFACSIFSLIVLFFPCSLIFFYIIFFSFSCASYFVFSISQILFNIFVPHLFSFAFSSHFFSTSYTISDLHQLWYSNGMHRSFQALDIIPSNYFETNRKGDFSTC